MKEKLARVWGFIKRHKWSALLVTLAIIVAGFFLWDSFSAGTTVLPDINIKKKPKLEKVRAPLSGRLVDSALAERTPIAVVVENHPDARPQSGLNKASLVYETFAEGGITRFLAFFQEEDVKEIGPVRSARPYFVEWAKSYDAIFGHVGGSIDALDLIASLKVFDLNQFNFGSFFWRDNSRYAPHNVYTTTEKLKAAAKTKSYPLTDDTIPAFSFKDDAKKETLPPAYSFKVNFNYSYAVTYAYSPIDNYFYRSILGQKQLDRPTGEQVRAKNVIVCFSDFSYGKTRIGEQKVNIRTTGSGKASFFIDGKRTEGIWKRPSGGITRFYDAKGDEIKLNAGTTWVDFVPQGTVVK